MGLAAEYKRQFAWRAWSTAFDALPPLGGALVLDLGCGIGDQAAELAARGARVIGVDSNDELLDEARSRALEGVEFRRLDLAALPDLGLAVDGVWSSFASAYFPDLAAPLAAWTRNLRPGGWMALTEIDDLFGHAPLGIRTRSLLDAYAQEARTAKRYDFHMGRKLRAFMESAGARVSKSITLEDQELSFSGPARPAVLDAWRARLDRMKLLQDFCGTGFAEVRDEFLGCLAHAQHRSETKVECCIGIR